MPVLIFKKLLYKIGYTNEDDLNQLAREDNSYYFKFVYERPHQIKANKVKFTKAQLLLDVEDIKHVDLSNKSIYVIPDKLKQNALKIESLNLSKNVTLTLSAGFIEQLKSLKILNLSQCQLRVIPPSITKLENLHHLDVSQNKITQIDNLNASKLKCLTSINLSNNSITSIEENVILPLRDSLSFMDLSNNRFSEFPRAVCLAINLVELDFSFNRLSDLPQEVEALRNLRKLVLISNNFSGKLPNHFGKLTQLRELDIRNNAVNDLNSISNLGYMEQLHCNYNTIYSVALSLRSAIEVHLRKNAITHFNTSDLVLTGISYLDLSYNKLVSLPDDVFIKIPNLQTLILNNNHLINLPGSISVLFKLHELSCANNIISSIPDDISNLKELKRLDIHNNNIKDLPSSIWKLKFLYYLNISSNLIRTLPDLVIREGESVGLVSSLCYLIAGDNRLTEKAFDKIGKLVNLKMINLSYNNIEEITSNTLEMLVNLESLFISGNQLKTIPSEQIEKLRNLQVLFINSNLLNTLPGEIGKLGKLQQLDVGCNSLRYNICNWPYDWNW